MAAAGAAALGPYRRLELPAVLLLRHDEGVAHGLDGVVRDARQGRHDGRPVTALGRLTRHERGRRPALLVEAQELRCERFGRAGVVLVAGEVVVEALDAEAAVRGRLRGARPLRLGRRAAAREREHREREENAAPHRGEA